MEDGQGVGGSREFLRVPGVSATLYRPNPLLDSALVMRCPKVGESFVPVQGPGLAHPLTIGTHHICRRWCDHYQGRDSPGAFGIGYPLHLTPLQTPEMPLDISCFALACGQAEPPRTASAGYVCVSLPRLRGLRPGLG